MISSNQSRNPAAQSRADGNVFLLLLAALFAAAWMPGQARAQGIEQRLYSFGLPGAANPNASLIQGSDGAFYGTTLYGGTNGAGTVFRIGTNGNGYAPLYSFTGTGGDGANPLAGLIQGADGALYGTAYYGGSNNLGTVFRIGTNGSGYTVLYSFSGTGGDGAYPEARLIQGVDGALYGTTYYGGTNGGGTVFRIGTNGTGYAPLYSFSGTGGDGAYPQAGLIQGADGVLYGTTDQGGTNNGGTVFRIGTNGTGYAVLYRFTGTGGDGAIPVAGLIQGADRALYGTTHEGGTSGSGSVFRIGTNGSGYAVLYSFGTAAGDGAGSFSGLIQGADRALYGTTPYGGTDYGGTVFRIGTNGSGYAVLYSFTGTGGDGDGPNGLIQGADRALYSTTYHGGTNGDGTVFRIGTNGSSYAVLYTFTGKGSDGLQPEAGLSQGADGALYGTTYQGGTNNFGTVFRIGTNGSGYAVLYSFTGTGADGASPQAGLIQGADGALYGTTSVGGSSNLGTVFKIGTNGSGFSVLHSFTDSAGGGANPEAGLVQGADGALYGTAYYGGSSNLGTVFKIGTNGSGYAVLYSFSSTGGDGANPEARLTQGVDGALYGTTYQGGTNNFGTVFRIGTNGSGYAVLYSFTGQGGDGRFPYAGLIQGADGALYGTTSWGGTNNGGTVFRIGTNGTGYAVLYSFGDTVGDGRVPSGLVQGADGALYGTTYQGGTDYDGTVFRIGTNGTGYAVLYRFTGTGGDGDSPLAGLIQGADGAFYGTASYGGNLNGGTVFRLIPWPVGAGFLQISRAAGRGAQLSFVPPVEAASAISVSRDLVSWTLLTNLPASLGPVYFTDETSTNFAYRFYRASWTP